MFYKMIFSNKFGFVLEKIFSYESYTTNVKKKEKTLKLASFKRGLYRECNDRNVIIASSKQCILHSSNQSLFWAALKC